MRARTTTFRRWARVPMVLTVLAFAALMVAPAASAALPKGTVTASPTCYFTNPDGSYTVNINVTNNDSAPVYIKVGGENKFNPGADDQGQPDTFAPGTTVNAAQATFKASDWAKAEWRLNSLDYPLSDGTPKCAVSTVTAEGNLLATVVFGAIVTVAGALVMGERRRRRPAHEQA